MQGQYRHNKKHKYNTYNNINKNTTDICEGTVRKTNIYLHHTNDELMKDKSYNDPKLCRKSYGVRKTHGLST